MIEIFVEAEYGARPRHVTVKGTADPRFVLEFTRAIREAGYGVHLDVTSIEGANCEVVFKGMREAIDDLAGQLAGWSRKKAIVAAVHDALAAGRTLTG